MKILICSIKDRSCHGSIRVKSFRAEGGVIKEKPFCLHHRVFLGLLNRNTINHHHQEAVKDCKECEKIARERKIIMFIIMSIMFNDYRI